MRFYVFMLIMFLGSLASVSAQESSDLHLPDELYFHNFGGMNNRLFYVKDSLIPIEVFSTQYSIFDYFWSPDGSKIVFITNKGGKKTPELYSDDFQLIQELEIDLYEDDTFHFPMAWSPDSKTLLFISSSTDNPKILTLPVNSPAERSDYVIPVPDSEEFVQAYWSPDTNYLLYQTLLIPPITPTFVPAGEIRQPEAHNLYLFNLNTLQSTLVTNSSYRYCIAWSSDSSLFSSVAYYWRDEDSWLLGADKLRLYDLDLHIVEEINLPPIEPASTLACPMAWSNGGQQIALYFGQDKDDVFFPHESGVAVIDINTHKIQIVGVSVSKSYGIVSMHWSPDDSWIVIETVWADFRDVRLFSYDTGEGVVLAVQDGMPLFNPQWRVSNAGQE